MKQVQFYRQAPSSSTSKKDRKSEGKSQRGHCSGPWKTRVFQNSCSSVWSRWRRGPSVPWYGTRQSRVWQWPCSRTETFVCPFFSHLDSQEWCPGVLSEDETLNQGCRWDLKSLLACALRSFFQIVWQASHCCSYFWSSCLRIFVQTLDVGALWGSYASLACLLHGQLRLSYGVTSLRTEGPYWAFSRVVGSWIYETGQHSCEYEMIAP